MKYQNKISKLDSDRFTKEFVQWKHDDRCNISEWCREMIHFSIWSQISKSQLFYNLDELYSFIWERIIRRVNNFDESKSSAHTYLHTVISTSIIQYKKDSIEQKRNRQSEIIYSRDVGHMDTNEMEEQIELELKDFKYVKPNKEKKK